MFKSLSLSPLKIVSGAALLLTLVPSSAKAAIVWSESTGILEAPSFWYNPEVRTTSIMGFDEEQGVILPRDINHQQLNEWDDLTNLLSIESGTKVDSQMVYFANPAQLDFKAGLIDSYEPIEATATIKFTGKILGFIGDSRLLLPDNDLFAPDQTNRTSAGKWSLEEEQFWTALDKVTLLSEDTIQLDWSTHSSIDPLRVITEAEPVPEPLTLLGAGTAIAMGGFFKSKLKNKAKDS